MRANQKRGLQSDDCARGPASRPTNKHTYGAEANERKARKQRRSTGTKPNRPYGTCRTKKKARRSTDNPTMRTLASGSEMDDNVSTEYQRRMKPTTMLTGGTKQERHPCETPWEHDPLRLCTNKH